MKPFAVMAIVLVIALAVPCVMAQGGNPKVIDRDSIAFGKTYTQWQVAWNQWGIGTPVANHPLFDNGDCSVGQSGPVWFLGGKYCALNSPNCGYNNVVRYCSVPKDEALFIDVVDVEVSALELGDPTLSIPYLKKYAQDNLDGATNVLLEVDGAAIPHLKDRFRIQSDAFTFTLPDDNQFTAVGEGNFAGGTYFPGVDDGVYVMLSPLPAGKHVVHFHAFFPQYNFTLDVTYHLTIQK